MKKIMCIFLVVLITLLGTACKNVVEDSPSETEISDDILSEIFEIDTSNFAESNSVNHGVVISRIPEKSIEKTIGEKEIFHILGKDIDITYQDTQFHFVGDTKVHRYKIEGTDSGMVMLTETGELYKILGEIITLDISELEPSDTIQEKMEWGLAGLVDFSKYEYSKAEAVLNHTGTAYSYNFTYSNKINGYTSESVSIHVNNKGTIDYIQIKFPLPDLKTEDLQISKTRQDELITQKMKNMHDTETMKYLSHEIDNATLTMYSGEVCIYYSVLVDILMHNSVEPVGYGLRILIPLRLLTNN